MVYSAYIGGIDAEKSRARCYMLWCLLAVLAICMMPSQAYAQPPSASVATVLCTIYGWFTGVIGRLVAMLGVMALGLAAMFGRIQIGSILVTMTGIALIFGAEGILDALGLGGVITGTCANTTTAANILNSPLHSVLACTVNFFSGPLGRSLGSLAIIALGLFAMNGRISYHQALITGAGLAAVFGASGLVDAMGFNVASGGVMPTGVVCSVNTSMSNALCNVVSWFTGPIGQGLATLAIIIAGLGALFGKVSWPQATVVALGVGLTFGSVGVMDALGANIGNC